MSSWKTAAAGAAVLGVIVALLFGTGVVKLRDGSAADEEEPQSSDDDAETGEESEGKKKKKRKKKKKKKGKSSKEEDIADEFAGLGYLAGSVREEDKGREGLTQRDEERADPNMLVLVNLLGWSGGLEKGPVDANWDEIRLIDVEGKVAHTWKVRPFNLDRQENSTARLTPQGELVVVQNNRGVAKYDWKGNLLWRRMGLYHHDVNFDDEGRIYANIKRDIVIEQDDVGLPIIDNGISVLTAGGEPIEQWWLSDVLDGQEVYHKKVERLQAARRRRGVKKKFIDIFHLNSIEVLDAHADGLWKEGDLLVSIRNLDTIAVVDGSSKEVRWSWGVGKLQHQHSPTQTVDGQLAIFDNGSRRKWSRIVEVDPTKAEIAWKYEHRPEGGKGTFFSDIRGVVQWVDHRETFMVFSSQRGRIFELDREGEILWEYISPEAWKKKRVPIRGQVLEGETHEWAMRKLKRKPK